jgi:F420-0:gamma-glutamyl ligase
VSRVPVGVIRGFNWTPDEAATMQSIIRDSQNDLFR